MNAPQIVNVAYIGHKERKVDNVANSGVVWHGHGDVKPVSAMQWSQLALHPLVWALHTEVAQAAALTLGNTAPMPLTVSEPPKAGQPAADANEAPTGKPYSGKSLEVLLGSDLLPAHVQIGDELVQLGAVVAKAHEASGLTVGDWNGLVPQIREKLLADYIESLRAPAEQDATNGEVSEPTDDSAPPADANNEARPARRRRGAATNGEVS